MVHAMEDEHTTTKTKSLSLPSPSSLPLFPPPLLSFFFSHPKIQDFSHQMDFAAKSLNLKPHFFCYKSRLVRLASAADIEGHKFFFLSFFFLLFFFFYFFFLSFFSHFFFFFFFSLSFLQRGTDGKYYLLDFSRTMPPVEPQVRFSLPFFVCSKSTNSIFYFHFIPFFFSFKIFYLFSPLSFSNLAT